MDVVFIVTLFGQNPTARDIKKIRTNTSNSYEAVRNYGKNICANMTE